MLIERLLKACGTLISWKRSSADPNRLPSFGIAEFDCLESVFACLKTMSNLKLYDGQLTVKADQKTQSLLNDWVDTKRGEWI